MNTRKLTAAVAAILAAAALSGCGASTDVDTVRAGIEAQIAYYEGGCGTPTTAQAQAHAAALAITDPGFLRDRLDDAICADGAVLPMNGGDR